MDYAFYTIRIRFSRNTFFTASFYLNSERSFLYALQLIFFVLIRCRRNIFPRSQTGKLDSTPLSHTTILPLLTYLEE